ncbi:MAG: anti-phage ZorAB system protein ZorA [Rhodocyclaceae bacterium]|jgi:ABC-type transporter Mla subunit MlaD|nr:anti-phage ZorAB system protein ZorA [Rhodocyclaceae bacterium]
MTTKELLDNFLNNWHAWTVGAIITLVSFGFLFRFVFPARRLGRMFASTIDLLSSLKEKASGAVIDIEEIARKAMSEPRLSHLWSEYAETLHPQRGDDGAGNMRIQRWRATALAETFFSEHALVDSPLKTEFYKHIPGILTGLGIIGTFSGLIMGLIHFDVSIDPTKAQAELSNLVKAVGHAFFVSAAAIALAMLFTWIEKSLVTARYRQVEALCHLIDSLFDAGAGEEYLERIVAASETQATQAAHIKDALVADLREILTELTARQVEEHARATGQMSVDVGKAIAEHLGEPIGQIAEAVKGVSASQGDALNKMLTDVLSSFSAQMRDMFGGQMQGMSDLLRQTSDAMRDTASQFAKLADGMDSAGKNAIEAMADRLNHAITSMEARQQIMNKQMGEFVEQLRSMAAESQSETGRKMQEALSSMGEQVAAAVGELRRQAEEASDSQGRRQQVFEESTGKAIGSLSQQTEALLAQSVETNRALQETISWLSSATTEAISGMNQGAETLYVAASDFAKAGQGVSETMRASASAVETIRESSGTLSSATNAAREILADYARTKDTFALIVTEMKSIVENARKEASMTSEIVKTLNEATAQLSAAERQSEEYLRAVSEVLGKAHESFADNVTRTLREGNRQFQKELGDAVGLLSGAIKDLGDTLDDLPTKR